MQLANSKVSVHESEAFNFMPTRILEIELGQSLPVVSAFDAKTGHFYRRAMCLIRLHTQPLGTVELELRETGLGPDEYAPYIWHHFHTQINEHLRHDGFLAVTELDASGLSGAIAPACLEERRKFLIDAPFVSVIVATRDRPEQIQVCLQSLMNLDYPRSRYEIIVVDNAPSTEATAEFIRQFYDGTPYIRYVREDRPGLARARNSGIMVARGEILAITDDDVIIDRYWLVELVKGFKVAADVACVTGLVLPWELETPAQFLLEEYGGFSKGFIRRIFDRKENHPRTPLYPYTAGRFGTGASLAFKATYLHSIGGFDPALGAGTAAKGGEDLAVFFQVIMHGHKLVYEPAALLYHPHRRDYTALRKQMYHYGVGLTAYLTKILLDNLLLLLGFIPNLFYGLTFAFSSASLKNSKKSAHYPKELTTDERKGMVHGPFAYVHSRWITRKMQKE